MANIAVFMDRTKNFVGDMVPLPKDFVSRFVATARRNKTLVLGQDPEWPDILFMRGTDQRGRKLVGSWNATPVGSRDSAIIMFRDTAQDGIHQREIAP